MRETRRVPAWKQAYAAFLLAYITAARPGSFSVTKGYSAGAPIGGPGSTTTRADTHILYWGETTWHRMPDGKIGCKIVFKYSKGHQDQYRRQYIDGTRQIFLVPKDTRLHLDLASVLFCIAFERGLFRKKSLKDLLEGNERTLATDPLMHRHPVFLAMDTQGTLINDKPCTSEALNRKLRELGLKVGLTDPDNSMYGFRRAAASETIHRHSLEEAQKLLGHDVGSAVTLRHYDPVGMGRIDLTQLRVGGEGMDTDAIARYFSQASSRFTGLSLQTEVERRLEIRLNDNGEYQDLDKQLEDLLQDCHKGLQMAGVIPREEDYHPVPNAQKRYLDLLHRADTEQHEEVEGKRAELLALLASRKSSRRDIRIKVKKEIMREIKAEEQAKATVDEAAEAVEEATEEDEETVAWEDEEDEEAVEESDEDVDDSEDRARYDTAEEPQEWRQVKEGDLIIIDDNYLLDSEEMPPNRAGWLRKFIEKKDSEIQTSGLHCSLCLADPTMDQKAKIRSFTLSKLAQHVKSKTHTRGEQLSRAFKLHPGPDVPCPIPACTATTNQKKEKASGFLDHVKMWHPEQLWEDDTEDVEDVAAGEVGDGIVADATGGGTAQDSEDEILFD